MNPNTSHLSAVDRGNLSNPRGGHSVFNPGADRSGAAPKRFVAKGHDAQLQAAQHDKSHVVVNIMGSSEPVSYSGQLVRRDKYTITIRVHNGDEYIIYKHAIESVLVTKSATSTPAQG
jgi:sRNA-binding regulator protein Hfq